MPELPEVETTRKGIEPHLAGYSIVSANIRERRLRWPIPHDLEKRIEGQAVVSVRRRGKYLLLAIANGHLLVHLGMSGSLRLVKPDEALLKHDHVTLHLSNDLTLRFNDPRRFGCMLWVEGDPLQHELLCNLGPEPLSEKFSGEHLYQRSRGRKTAVKNFIMDSHIVVGVGNIYASEALFMSGIRPGTASQRISKPRYEILAGNIRQVLTDAIAMGGTTLRDFVGGDGKPGYFQQTLNVYGRKNEPCTACRTAIKHIVLGQRSTYYCPVCQK